MSVVTRLELPYCVCILQMSIHVECKQLCEYNLTIPYLIDVICLIVTNRSHDMTTVFTNVGCGCKHILAWLKKYYMYTNK